jgi:hypothetical protein
MDAVQARNSRTNNAWIDVVGGSWLAGHEPGLRRRASGATVEVTGFSPWKCLKRGGPSGSGHPRNFLDAGDSAITRLGERIGDHA